MPFSPQFAEKRFGYGLSPLVPPVASVEAMLAGLQGPDLMAQTFPIEDFATFRLRMLEAERARQNAKKVGRKSPEGVKFTKQARIANKFAREAKADWFMQSLLRRTRTPQAFRERLVAFWGDHFTAQGKQGVIRRATSPYLEDAIRPNIAGRFADLLIAAVTHPLMLHYLDQAYSIGPGSAAVKNRKGQSGLNENLAREVIELHTLGVGGPYTQADVRQLAELFTGLSFKAQEGFVFRSDFVEPGEETVLGRTYGPAPGMGPIHQVLEDLAVHPATAEHIARKLAVHFVSDTPDPALVEHLRAAYAASAGDLGEVYAALLDHPAAWQTDRLNFKQPEEFVSSALRALAAGPDELGALDEKQVIGFFYRPMRLMGQLYQQPGGPDGWAEEDEDWLTPQGLAARLEWSMQVPRKLFDSLPDPRSFVQQALGDDAPSSVIFAAEAAETRHEAIGLVLSSPAFQRR